MVWGPLDWEVWSRVPDGCGAQSEVAKEEEQDVVCGPGWLRNMVLVLKCGKT